MISTKAVHDDIRSILKKYNSYFVSPGDIDIAINKARIDVVQALITAHEESGNKFMADQDLLVLHSFTTSLEVRVLPDDVFKVSSVYDGENEGDLLDDKRFNDRINSVIIPPIAARPVATVYNESGVKKIRIVPASTTHKIKYWKVPVACNYAFTQTNGVVTNNPVGTIDLDLPMSQYSNLVNRTLTYLSPAAKDADAANLENILK
jgi:hypothetical protein